VAGEGIIEFLNKYFVNPYKNFEGYNLVNTTAYAVILIVIINYLYKFLKRFFKFDKKFLCLMMSYVLMGSIIRSYVDNDMLPYTPVTVSPGIWFLFLGLVLGPLGISKIIEKKKKIDYHSILIPSTIIANILIIIPLLMKGSNFTGVLLILVFFSAVSSVYLFTIKKLRIKFLGDLFSKISMLSHFLDASATFVGIDFYGLWEQHPVTRFFGEIAGTYMVFYLLKIAVISLTLYFINTDVKDKEFSNWLKLFVVILGLGPGIRDTLMVLTLT